MWSVEINHVYYSFLWLGRFHQLLVCESRVPGADLKCLLARAFCERSTGAVAGGHDRDLDFRELELQKHQFSRHSQLSTQKPKCTSGPEFIVFCRSTWPTCISAHTRIIFFSMRIYHLLFYRKHTSIHCTQCWAAEWFSYAPVWILI